MEMPVYKVTEAKIKEYLGDDFTSYLSPLKGKGKWAFLLEAAFLVLIYLFLGILTFSGIFTLDLPVWIVSTIIILAFSFIVYVTVSTYLSQKEDYLRRCAEKIKDLVNDPQLLWFNNRKTAYPEQDKINGKWGTESKGKLVATTFQILAYLKKEGNSQGIAKQIKSLRTTSSAKKVMKRLADKTNFDQPILDCDGSDFKYVPWKFKLVDARGLVINTLEAEKLEEVLKTVWDKMIAEEGKRWG